MDTFETGEKPQARVRLHDQENTERVKRQKARRSSSSSATRPTTPGRPNENDNNKNRKYPVIDRRVADTYAADSKATLRNKLSRPLRQGLPLGHRPHRRRRHRRLCHQQRLSRRHRLRRDAEAPGEDFDAIYVLDLSGNVRKNPKLSGTTHNVFGIQVGVSITFLVRTGRRADAGHSCLLRRVPTSWRKERNTASSTTRTSAELEWQRIKPDAKHTWLTEGLDDGFRHVHAAGHQGGKADRNRPAG